MSDLATRLRTACDQVRVKSYPLSDLIPLMQQAADALAAAPEQPAPSAAPAEPLQAFDSPRAKSLMRAWEEGWEACRDAEYVGEEAQNDAFNSSHTLTLCLAEDQLLPTPQADSVLEDAAREYAEFPDAPLSVFSKGQWYFSETGQAFSADELDEAAFVAYRTECASTSPAARKQGANHD